MSSRDRDAALAIPAWPVLQLVLDELGRATVDGRPIQIPPDTDPQAGLLAAATRRAADLGRPLRVRAIDPAGTWHLVAYPDGEVSELPGAADLPVAPPRPEAGRERSGPDDDEHPAEAGASAARTRDDAADGEDDDPDHPGGRDGSDDPGDEDQDNGWHLRVHPNGMIIPVEEVPASVDDDFISPPHTRWESEARPPGEPVDRHLADPRPATPPAPLPEPELEAAPEPDRDPLPDREDRSRADREDRLAQDRGGRPAQDRGSRPDPVALPVPPAGPVPAAGADPVEEATDEPIAEELDAPAPEVDPDLDREPEPEREAALGPELEPVPGPELAAPDDDPEVEAEATSRVRAEADPAPDLPSEGPSDPEPDEPPGEPRTVRVPLVPLVDDTVRVQAPPVDERDDDGWRDDTATDDTIDDSWRGDDRPVDDAEAVREDWYHLGQVPDDPPPAAARPDPGSRPDPRPDRDPHRDAGARPGVDSDGIVHGLRSDLPDQPRQRSRRWIPAAVATVVLAGLAVAIAVAVTGGDRTPAAVPTAGAPGASVASTPAPSGAARAAVPPATPPPTLTAPPGALAIGPPPGFTATPVWGLPVSSSSTTTVAADGRVVTLTADRQVAIVDPATGAVQWHAPTPTQSAGPYLSRIDGKPVVAMITTSRLTYWTLPDKGAPAAGTAPVEIDLPPGGAVTWAGPSPLVTLGDGGVGVVQGGDVRRVSLPTGARALAADGGDVLAVAGRDWIRQTAGQDPGVPRQLAVPKGATGTVPVKVENVGGSFLGAMWAGADGPVVAVYDARTGGKLVEATFPKDVDFSTATTVREVGSERTVVGTALFEPAQHHLTILASSFTPRALAPGHVYANDKSGAVADLQINGTALKAVRFPSSNPTVPVGLANSGSRKLAIVVVPNGSGWLLCALPSA